MQRLSLQQKLQQKLSPLQIQVIKLLEIPTIELEQRIKQELEENPVLDEGREENIDDPADEKDDSPDDDFSIDEYLNDDDIPAYKLKTQNHSPDDKIVDIPFSVGVTFHEHLINQLSETELNDQERIIAEYIIGNIDEDGYLRRDTESMVDDLAFMHNISASDKEMKHILEVIQEFEPAGVGARDLQECLLLQLERKRYRPELALAIEALEDNFDLFTKKHFDKIIKKLNTTEAEFKLAMDEIIKLNPKPGSVMSSGAIESVQQITPDFILEINNDELILSLNQRNVPELKLSQSYKEMLQDLVANKKGQTAEQKDTLMFVKQKLDSAKWFIEALKQRHDTLFTTMQAIVDMQHDFFLEGDETQLKPMHLKDVAEKTGFDISTISRVSNSKYIETPYGIYKLKYFFSEAMQTDTGEEVSSKEIKMILSEAIDAEDKRHPLTDEALMEVLKAKGYVIARRTVAKYREQFGYPVARLRKEL